MQFLLRNVARHVGTRSGWGRPDTVRCGSGRGLKGSRTFSCAFRMQDSIRVFLLLGTAQVFISRSQDRLPDILEHVESCECTGQGGHEWERTYMWWAWRQGWQWSHLIRRAVGGDGARQEGPESVASFWDTGSATCASDPELVASPGHIRTAETQAARLKHNQQNSQKDRGQECGCQAARGAFFPCKITRQYQFSLGCLLQLWPQGQRLKEGQRVWGSATDVQGNPETRSEFTG